MGKLQTQLFIYWKNWKKEIEILLGGESVAIDNGEYTAYLILKEDKEDEEDEEDEE